MFCISLQKIELPYTKIYTMKLLLFLTCLLCTQSICKAQSTFYKQFEGKLNGKTLRMTLIKAPSKDNPEYNIRGSAFYVGTPQTLYLTNGTLDEAGNLYMEEGVYKQDNTQFDQAIFAKTGIWLASYSAEKNQIIGTWASANNRQNYNFVLQEDYNNGAIPVDLVFNDTNYEGASIRFHYPRFKQHPQAEKLNQYIKTKVLGDMSKKITNFMEDYKKASSGGGMVDDFSSKNVLYVGLNDSQVITLRYLQEENTGVSHGSKTIKHENINLRNGEMITLQDIFMDKFETELTKIVEQQLRHDFQITATESLTDYGFSLPAGKFGLNKNFYIKRDGIGFFYNMNEIASYAVGAVDIFLPFEKIKHLIKKEGVLKAFL